MRRDRFDISFKGGEVVLREIGYIYIEGDRFERKTYREFRETHTERSLEREVVSRE